MDLATAPRPRFRTDLVAEVMEAEGQRFIDVIDPDTGDAFRFYEVEYSLACAMDGERDVHGLVQWAKEELGIEPSRAELESVITTLGTLGYLDSVALRPGVVAPPREAYRGGPEIGRSPDGSRNDVELGQMSRAPSDTRQPITRGADIELGAPGFDNKVTRRIDELPVDDVELGSPGFSGAAPEPMPSLRRQTRPEDEEEGPTQLPAARAQDFDDEVSVDLSEHLSIRPSDVKEAVRMSRSMKAVEVPPEVLEEIGQKEAEAASRVEQARAAAQAAHELEAEEPTPPPAELPHAPAAVRPPVELPPQPVVVSRKKPSSAPPIADRAPSVHAKPLPAEQPGSGGVSTLLIVLLVLAILGGGAFFVWKYVINKPKADDTQVKEPGPGTGEGTAAGTASGTGTGTGTGTAAAPPPEPPTATLALQGDPPVQVAGGKGGVVTMAVADGSEIQVGDPIVEYQGIATLRAKLGDSTSGLVWDIETRYPREIEAATKKRDAALAAKNKAGAKPHEAKIKERTRRLEEQSKVADGLREKIAALTIEAPVAGKVVDPVKKGKRVPADGVVATIETGQSLVATFEVAEGSPTPAVDASVKVTAKDAPDQTANCTVAKVEGTKVTVSCPADSGLADGATVVLDLE